jgi:hypothetical protein
LVDLTTGCSKTARTSRLFSLGFGNLIPLLEKVKYGEDKAKEE